MLKIVGKFLLDLKQMVTDKNVSITVSDEALDALVDKGFDPKMGARPLQRVIDKEIKRPLSRQLLFGDLKNGGTVSVDYDTTQDKFTLECKKVEEVVEEL
jgi:ATP-dependent Clp protease ATP-binding subunit ClpA